jgi:hypothetical protein
MLKCRDLLKAAGATAAGAFLSQAGGAFEFHEDMVEALRFSSESLELQL